MKKTLLILLTIFAFNTVNAQIDIGIQGGPNYNWSGFEYDNYTTKNSAGWHIGALVKIEFSEIGLFVEADPTYTKLNVEIVRDNFDLELLSTDRLDLPVLVGIKVLGLLRIFAGPVFSSNVNTVATIKDWNVDVEDEISTGFQIGAGVELGSMIVDVRYEGGSDSDIKINGIEFDNRSNQILLNVAYLLW
ncbi:MAG: outer membrane beta-barrel protein [Ichthyobacteriaceae bacterium]|nr:outer membrane beta-barrel protein [Ichthyobacteriaceae bacterium]